MTSLPPLSPKGLKFPLYVYQGQKTSTNQHTSQVALLAHSDMFLCRPALLFAWPEIQNYVIYVTLKFSKANLENINFVV